MRKALAVLIFLVLTLVFSSVVFAADETKRDNGEMYLATINDVTLPELIRNGSVVTEVSGPYGWYCDDAVVKYEIYEMSYVFNVPSLLAANFGRASLVLRKANDVNNITHLMTFKAKERQVKVLVAEQYCWYDYEYEYDANSNSWRCIVKDNVVCDDKPEILTPGRFILLTK